MKADYTREDVVHALRAVGAGKGDSIFTHSNIGFFGRLEGAKDAQDYYCAFKGAIFDVIGPEGTFVVPTFSYSFCRGTAYDAEETAGVCGMLSEMVRKDPEAKRSEDANFSVSAIGGKAIRYTQNTPEHSFGADSFWDRFLRDDGKIVNLNFDAGSTFIHFVEKSLQVPYRYDKAFRGTSVSGVTKTERTFYHFVYDMAKPNNQADFTKFDKRVREQGLVRTAKLGKGSVLMVRAKDTFSFIEKELAEMPSLLIKGETVE